MCGVETISGRFATVTVLNHGHAGSIFYLEGPTYDEIRLGRCSQPVEYNSVVLIPQLVSMENCDGMVAEVEDIFGSRGWAWYPRPAYERFRIPEMSDHAQSILDRTLREKLLPFVKEHLPGVERSFWEKSKVQNDAYGPDASITTVPLRFSDMEPAINRYAVGGTFAPHSDKLALTLNVLLSTDGAFAGGGTEFWIEPNTSESDAPDVLIEPKQGCGLVFNGRVLHAGREVTEGLRHLLVASFSIMAPEMLNEQQASFHRTKLGKARSENAATDLPGQKRAVSTAAHSENTS